MIFRDGTAMYMEEIRDAELWPYFLRGKVTWSNFRGDILVVTLHGTQSCCFRYWIWLPPPLRQEQESTYASVESYRYQRVKVASVGPLRKQGTVPAEGIYVKEAGVVY